MIVLKQFTPTSYVWSDRYSALTLWRVGRYMLVGELSIWIITNCGVTIVTHPSMCSHLRVRLYVTSHMCPFSNTPLEECLKIYSTKSIFNWRSFNFGYSNVGRLFCRICLWDIPYLNKMWAMWWRKYMPTAHPKHSMPRWTLMKIHLFLCFYVCYKRNARLWKC